MESYDDLPYVSRPFGSTHPAHLQAMCSLVGLQSRDFRAANVLEIGCSFGGNIIPLAQYNPDMHITGIDLSTTQIGEGQQIIKQMGLDNIELIQQDICEYQVPENHFDYIICHGVYSWVPDIVKDAILAVIQAGLSDKGVAYVSYNTYPGWKIQEFYRDAMLFHSKGNKNIDEKYGYALAMLDFLKEGTDPEFELGVAMERDYSRLKNSGRDYFVHEYLAECNDPMYFYQFVEQLDKHKLTYAMDANIQNQYQYSDHVSDTVREQIASYEQVNFIAKEQYKDFVHNQTFRCSIITKQSVADKTKINYTSNIDNKILENLYVVGFSKDSLGADIKIDVDAWLEKIIPSKENEQHRQVTSFIANALINANGQCLQVKTLLERWQAGIKRTGINVFYQNISRLMLDGSLLILPYQRVIYDKIDVQPKVAKPTRELVKYFQAQEHETIQLVNDMHRGISLSVVDMEILPLLDGKHSVTDLCQAVNQAVQEKRIIMKNNKTGAEMTDPTELAKAILVLVELSLESLSELGLLQKKS